MKLYLKVPRSLVLQISADLNRPHSFAHERIGFLTIGASSLAEQRLLLLARDYSPVADEDYERDPSCGARIGGAAFRKAVEHAYRGRSGLVHIHSHGGAGIPCFSETDVRSGGEFVPGFFEAIPSMPHGMIVLSGDRAAGRFWLNKARVPTDVAEFAFVGAPLLKFGMRR